MARCLACLASLGRCSLNFMPGTVVAISLKGPPFLCPGLRSNVSIWLGPPFIHKRMHERFRSGLPATALAKFSSQPDMEAPRTPAADNRNHSRRDNCKSKRDMGKLLGMASGVALAPREFAGLGALTRPRSPRG